MLTAGPRSARTAQLAPPTPAYITIELTRFKNLKGELTRRFLPLLKLVSDSTSIVPFNLRRFLLYSYPNYLQYLVETVRKTSITLSDPPPVHQTSLDSNLYRYQLKSGPIT